MCKVLMSIKPDYVENILSGKKKFEFRKVKCKRKIDSIVIYSTAPIMQIVAEVKVLELIEGTPDYVWNLTHNNAGVDKVFFDSYYNNKSIAFAYRLGEVLCYTESKSLADYGVKCAPQSFIYLYD